MAYHIHVGLTSKDLRAIIITAIIMGASFIRLHSLWSPGPFAHHLAPRLMHSIAGYCNGRLFDEGSASGVAPSRLVTPAIVASLWSVHLSLSVVAYATATGHKISPPRWSSLWRRFAAGRGTAYIMRHDGGNRIISSV